MTKRAVTIGGVELPEGAKLFLWLAVVRPRPRASSRSRIGST